MAAVNSMLNRQFMNSMMDRNLRMSMFGLNYYKNYNPKFDFVVTDSLGMVQNVRSKINIDTALHKYYLEYEDKNLPKSDPNRKVKIYPKETISISRKDGYSGKMLNGMATDSCWLFKVIDGPITAYAFLAESPDSFDETTIVGIQKGENMPILPFRPENLKLMIADDKEATEQFKSKKYYKALKKYNKNKQQAITSK
ncbi:hypothetical protein LJ707_09900 [Mucilaginibacter sp. UR6-1]|uniref:hypothetical protein n=1 Tax=Mucilaginibacter sp. UR6-1 TaxID=1435643 RepID=UPI001E29C0C3|nr:hypothetical protein [Mucilaginibacter sp. UR6-1]MCC8409246.1 hypothetical protein [Mucilaginibacter sp. UR6-1]